MNGQTDEDDLAKCCNDMPEIGMERVERRIMDSEIAQDRASMDKAAYMENMARANAVGYQPQYGGIRVPTPEELRAGALQTAMQFNAVNRGASAADIVRDARTFLDYVQGVEVTGTPIFEPARYDYSEIISDTLAASDAEAETARAPGGARVSYAYMMGRIANTHFTYPPACPHMTVAEVTFDNGFTLIGSSAPADPRNFDVKLGQKYALENAMRQAWPLFGFLLCELQHEGRNLYEFMLPDPSDSSTASPEPTPTASVHEAIYGGTDDDRYNGGKPTFD